jgi:hypothetical protein
MKANGQLHAPAPLHPSITWAGLGTRTCLDATVFYIFYIHSSYTVPTVYVLHRSATVTGLEVIDKREIPYSCLFFFSRLDRSLDIATSEY